MTKTQKMMYLDDDVYNKYQTIVGNRQVSQKIEDYMQQCVNISNGEASGISLEILKKQREKVLEEHTHISSELSRLDDSIKIHTKALEEKEMVKLEQEREVAEAVKKCVVCKDHIGDMASHQLAWTEDDKEFFVHNRCYMDWIGKQDKEADISKDALKKDLQSQVVVE